MGCINWTPASKDPNPHGILRVSYKLFKSYYGGNTITSQGVHEANTLDDMSRYIAYDYDLSAGNCVHIPQSDIPMLEKAEWYAIEKGYALSKYRNNYKGV